MKKRETVNLAEDTANRIAQIKARESEERLRESEQKFRALFDNAKDAIFIHDLEGRFLDVNREACERLGYSRDELLQMGVRDIDIPEFAAMVPARIEEVLRKGHVLFESEHRRRDGSRVPVEINSSLLEVGGKTLVFSTCRDITARKQAEQALRESEERHRRLFERMHDGFAYCRMLYENDSPQDFIYLDVNDAFARLTGLKNVIGKKISEVIPGIQKTNPELFQIYGRVALSGEPETCESYLEALGIWFSISVYSPQKEHFVAVFENITERKRAEANRLLLTDTLQILNRSGDLHSLVRDVLGLIRERAGFDAVGLRLRQGEDCPYYHHDGFSEDFLREENFLCAKRGDGAILHDAEGRAVLECTCGLVLSGRTDPCMSCFTKGGSFWTNVSTELLALPREDDPRTNPRNNCIHRGYQSVGLFPVRAGQEIIGLLQLNDRREGRFTPESIAFYEALAQNIGLALQRTVAEESLRESEERFRTAFEMGAIAMCLTSLETKLLKVNSAFCRMLGFSEAELVGLSFTQITHPEDVAANLAGLQRIISGEIPSFRMEKRYICKDGRLIWADMSTAAVRDAQGRPSYIVTHIQDITERKRAEEAVRRHAALLDLAHDAIMVRGLGDEVAWWSRGAEETYGWTREEAMGRVTHDLLKPRFPKELAQVKAEVIEKGQWEGELIHTRKDGQQIVVASRWAVQRDPSGRPVGFLEINRDITERKRAEDALRASEKRFSKAFAASPDAIILSRVEDGIIREVNESFVRLFGFEAPEVIGKRSTDLGLVNPADRERALQKLKKEGRLHNFEMQIRTRSGEIRWTLCSIEPIELSGESLLLSIARDITERKRAEEALRRSEARLMQAVRVARLGIFEHDHRSGVIEYSPVMRELLGFGQDEEITIDATLRRAVPEDREALLAAIRRAHDPAGDGSFGVEYRVALTDGRIRWISKQSQTFFEGEGSERRPVRTIGAALDVTERKEAQAALERLVAERTAKLQEMIGELEHFSYTITHDMRAPLRAMQGFGNMLLEECAECLHPQRREFIRRIVDSAGRMDSLITDALNYSKVVQQELELEPVDAAKLLHGMVESYPRVPTPSRPKSPLRIIFLW